MFMWGYQHHFRGGLEAALQQVLREIGIATEPTVLLVGVLAPGGSRQPICIEPENGAVVPSDFGDLPAKAQEIYRRSPESRIRFSDTRSHNRKQEEFRYRAYATAIKEVLEKKLALRFFVADPTQVEQHFVYTAVGLPARILDSSPRLSSTNMLGRYPTTQSLTQGVVDQVLRRSQQALLEPDAGRQLHFDLNAADVAREAGKALTLSATALAGNDMPTDLFNALNQVATTRYEQRVGIGSLLIARRDSPHVKRSVNLREPVRVDATRAFRKLLETSRADGQSLLTDGEELYGLGRLKPGYPVDSESIFQVQVLGDGNWELQHAKHRLATVKYGEPRLPAERVDRDRFVDLCLRIFGECKTDTLWKLVMASADASHGTMLVISADASAEADRLQHQALVISPASLSVGLARQFTDIDGALLVDQAGRCHAAGLLLDGIATNRGDRSRGARYNSAVRYLSMPERGPTVILLVSEDKMINLLPDTPSRISRRQIAKPLADLRKASVAEPLDAEKFYRAYRSVEANAFYLSPSQVEEVNTLMENHWERRTGTGESIRVIEKPLRPNPDMDDSFFLD
jgi:hypothetical protein